jgi:Icc protein
VFEDLNGNGIDDGEPGIPDILVSNGVAVTLTDGVGAYSLPMEGYFVFITTPGDYEPTTPWYLSTQGTDLDFGLAPSPGKATDEFVFVQMSDVHIDTAAEHVALFQQDVAEISNIDPAFVIATGDLVSSGDTAMISQASQWFDVYSSVTSGFNMPLYNTVGNHDVVGINNPEVDPAELGYNKEMYRDYLGPTYYSFDWGPYHCLVLDPNEFIDGRQVYRMPDYQLEWLQQDLTHRQWKPLLVFFHEPTPSWENRTEVLNLLKQHEVLMFSGHWHFDILIDSQGILEQVTGALCGEWWFGPCPDGKPCGYRLISIDADGISSFYKGVVEERQINITSPDAIVSGQATLTAQVYTEYGAITGASYRVDGGGLIPMSIEEGQLWDTAAALWDTTWVEQGHHTITIEARDEMGTFSREMDVKVTEEQIVPLGELVSHFDAYQGRYTNVRGQVSLVAMGKPYAQEGSGAIVILDETGGMVIIVGECTAPPPPALASGDMITVRAVPVKYSWDFLKSTGEFGLIHQFASLLPEGLLVSDEAGPKEVRVMRLLSGADVQVLPPPPSS